MKNYATCELGRSIVGENFMWGLREDHIYIPEEHDHTSGDITWIPISYYDKHFWEIKELVERLEKELRSSSDYFCVEDKCHLCYNVRRFLTRIYHSYLKK